MMIREVSIKVIACVVAVLLVIPVLGVTAETAEAVDLSGLVVTLDPGHGGADPGTMAATAFGGENEAVYTYSLCLYMKERLEQSGVTVYLTRTEGENPSLSRRAEIAAENGSHALISIHNNSYTGASANGAEVLVPSDNYRPAIGRVSRDAAEAVLERLAAETGVLNRGLKPRAGSQSYPDGSVADYYGVIRYGKMENIPIVMLVETAFASNKTDYVNQLSTAEARQRAAYAIADGFLQYILEAGIPAIPTAAALAVSNEAMWCLDKDGNKMGDVYAPGAFGSWKKTVTVTQGEAAAIVDWGWAAFEAESFRYGYLVNGQTYVDEAFTHETEETVQAAIAATGADCGSRFFGVLKTEWLTLGENTVSFFAWLNEEQAELLRTYTVILKTTEEEVTTEEETTTEKDSESLVVGGIPMLEETSKADEPGGCLVTVSAPIAVLFGLLPAVAIGLKKKRE